MARQPFFKNAQWKVTTYGLECTTAGYDIRVTDLGHLRGSLLSLPLHMAEKNWVDIRLFIEAFRAAISTHHITFDSAALDRSCARAVANSDYNRLHSAACDRIANVQNIGSPVGNWRSYDYEELERLIALADAELATAGIHPPEGWPS